MEFQSSRIPYQETQAFSRIVLDYVNQEPALKPFYGHPPTYSGLTKAMEERAAFPTDRQKLVTHVKNQYKDLPQESLLQAHMEALLAENCFTVTTAHQPNLFTGPLYVIYKILHAVRLADSLRERFPEKNFVPVYYMGSEDADLDELGHFMVDGMNYRWNTPQKGAVGRMKVDPALLSLIETLNGQLGVYPFGEEIVSEIKASFTKGETIQQATLRFLNYLFGRFGLVVLIADAADLKASMIEVFRNEILERKSASLVEDASSELDRLYKAQASGRDINLFYLENNIRNRIEWVKGEYQVFDTGIRFSQDEILKELEDHPERFSPNVILRGLYQETILPNIAFIGGGGELAYWMQLKNLFTHYRIPYPVLILRNSFLLLEEKWVTKLEKTGFSATEIFQSSRQLADRIVFRESRDKVKLNGTLEKAEAVYEAIKTKVGEIDSTLVAHADSLKSQAIKKLRELEKKMLRAEKRKYVDKQRQLLSIKNHLFPDEGLQERVDNFLYYYAKNGPRFLDSIYKHSLALEQEFVILQES